MGATIIEISLRKPSLSTFSFTAKSGTSTPSTIPSSRASNTCEKSDPYHALAGGLTALTAFESWFMMLLRQESTESLAGRRRCRPADCPPLQRLRSTSARVNIGRPNHSGAA
ncbi:hypothetical protein EMIT051CA3_70162 [Pseudomonas chlororaphis]